MVTEAINTARAAGAESVLVRGDSAYGTGKVVAAVVKAGARFSFVLTKQASVNQAIDGIPDDAWAPVHYPGAARRGRARFSVVLAKQASVNRAIDSIADDAWVPVQYPGAVKDPDTGAWISDAEVAEVAYTAFAGTRQEVTARLVVRRVLDVVPRDVGDTPGSRLRA